MFVSERPAVINTIVGSAVAVCLWTPKLAGMCHFVLSNGHGDASTRFGGAAITLLVERMSALGAKRDVIVAAVFGGAYLLDGTAPPDSIGQRNVREALQSLVSEQIVVVRREVGGDAARHVAFHTIDMTTIVSRL
jgi:chemotaxis protein CheD